jgi:hypothetical protein
VQVATDWGILGFVCFLGVYGAAFRVLSRVKKAALPSENGFYYWRALAIQLALIAYLVAGTFTDRLYGEAGYWLIGLAYALYRIQVTEQAASRGTASAHAHAQPQLLTKWPLAGAQAH